MFVLYFKYFQFLQHSLSIRDYAITCFFISGAIMTQKRGGIGPFYVRFTDKLTAKLIFYYQLYAEEQQLQTNLQ